MSRRLGVVLFVIVGALGFLVVKGLGDATTYFKNADEVERNGKPLPSLLGKRIRLQGTVVAGSVHETGSSVRFVVEYRCVSVPVHHVGGQPSLFKQGIPVVLEGRFARGSTTFESDRIIVKHTEEYKTKESDRLAAAARESQGCAR
ncbi:MAG: cytochrome c maturation protein CcmE [Acidobacteria bacterium]|nr:cytochrome c maturation protein CcmE [Acidobacteriota bacterium]